MVASAELPVMFRAGRGPGPAAEAAVTAALAQPALLMADISEFQPDVADAKYLAWSQAIVIRAMYGDAHDDGAWYGGARRADLLAGGARFLGIYQYLVAGQDAVAQAQALVRLLGTLNTGEVIICDLEEGSGSQLARWDAWAAVIRSELGDQPWRYSGLWFGESAGIAPVEWVAAYQSTEPSPAHRVWQFTDSYLVPGIGTCDCSVYHGTIDQLAALAHGGTQPVPPQPQPPTSNWTEAMIAELPTLAYGASGGDVNSCQGLLCARGYTVVIDGAYGPATRSAVTAFQHARSLTADGICGQLTWTELHKP